MRINSIRQIAMVCLAVGFAVFTAAAQDFRSVLTGQITDPSGAIIKGANVTAVNEASGTSYTGKTSDKGVYYIPYVLPGNYTVTAKAPGFKTMVQDKVALLASQTFNQNFQLQVGALSEQVVVTAAPPQLETSTGSGGTVIDQRTLQSVPLNGGMAYNLIGTTPGSQSGKISNNSSGVARRTCASGAPTTSLSRPKSIREVDGSTTSKKESPALISTALATR